MMRRLGLFGAVLLVLGVVYVAAWRTQPGASQTSARAAAPLTAAVTSVTRSCPPPAPNTGEAHIAMIAMPAQSPAAKTGTTAPGTAALSAVPAAPAGARRSAGARQSAGATQPATTTPSATSATPTAQATPAAQPVTVSAPSALTTVTAPGATGFGGTAVAATGQMAEGFEAEQANASGMGLVSCTHPSSDMWFVGTGAQAGASDIRLYLMNTGDMAASADLTILTDAGLQSGLNSGITIAPHQFVMENIAPFVRSSVALALHVQTSSGQIAASVWEGGSGGGAGGAWLPQAVAPSTHLVIPGLTVASSAARLFVTVPGATDAQLKVVAFTPAGKFPQFGSAPIGVPAGATSSFALSSLGASAAGLALSSNVPIIAGVLVPGAGIGSFTTAVPPVTEQGMVAGNPATRGLTVGLVLTAPGATARANITVIGTGGLAAAPASGQQQVATVRAGHTLAVTVPRPAGSRQPFAIVITPLAGSGPLYAARVVTTGTGGLSAPVASLLPVPSALTAITLPPARNTYSAVLP
jgi:Family of unknown function (DUF5719)